MGCGIYLVWPAFYTDVTNSYRLGRAGRLRTDLGGVYFNSLFILGLAALYLRDPCPLLLASILLINLEVVQQLLPTLRFDGYYIMSDLVGIPDLFKYIGPILRRTILRRPPEERLQALKRWPQVVVTIWVLAVLPALCLQLGVIVLRLPQMVTTAWTTSSSLVLGAAASSTPVLSTAAACLQILFILLPLVGVALVLWQLTKTLIQLVRRHYGRHAAGDGAPRRHRHGTPSLLLWGAVASVAVLAVGCLMWTLARPASGPAATPEGRRHTAGANPAPPQGAPPAEVRPPSHTTPPSDPTSTAHGHVKLPHTDSRTAAETRAAQEPPAHRQGTPATTEGPHLDDGKPAGARHTPRPPEPPVADQPAGPGDSAADDCARLMQLPLVPVGVLTICP
jgi:putative peptide zinc metalloprotease protein